MHTEEQKKISVTESMVPDPPEPGEDEDDDGDDDGGEEGGEEGPRKVVD